MTVRFQRSAKKTKTDTKPKRRKILCGEDCCHVEYLFPSTAISLEHASNLYMYPVVVQACKHGVRKSRAVARHLIANTLGLARTMTNQRTTPGSKLWRQIIRFSEVRMRTTCEGFCDGGWPVRGPDSVFGRFLQVPSVDGT